jgi:AcrR family transcriptional regulator
VAVDDGVTRRRQDRERSLVQATRALFDERGMQDAPIEEIAKAVGIARGLIYRQFSSKEELYVLTVTDYLDELAGVLDAAFDDSSEPAPRLERGVRAYAKFCARYPAFLDCSLSLMRRPAMELHAAVSESVWLRLGQGMARCVAMLTRTLEALGADDPDMLASVMWTQVLGAMHVARTRVGIREAAPGEPQLFPIEPAQVIDAVVASALCTAGASGRG